MEGEKPLVSPPMGSEPKPRVNFSRRGASAKRWRGEREGDVGSIGKPPLSKSGFPGSNPGVPENKTPPQHVMAG